MLIQVRRSWPVLLALVLLACWPLRNSLLHGTIPGAGPDVMSTLWGMWWFSQSWHGPAWGGWTDLANHPIGVHGAVLSPVSATVYSLLEPLVGIGRAAALTGVFQAAGLAGATALLARRMGCSPPATLAAGLVPLGMRYTWFGLGEGSVVAIAALFVPLGLLALREVLDQPRWSSTAAVAACMALTALENPYLAPVLPAAALALIVRALWRGHERRVLSHLVSGLATGCAGIAGVSALYGRVASPDYPPRIIEETRLLGPWVLEVIDKPWARLDPVNMVYPVQATWTLDAFGAEGATGGGYLGLAGLVLALSAVVLAGRKSWPWLILGLGSVVLALGSVCSGVPLPFLVFNDLLDMIARPLTQPTRFLTVAGVGLGVSAGLAADALASRQRMGPWIASAVLALDALVFGGLSLTLPTTELPDAPCVRDLREEEGAVLVWPGDGSYWEGDIGRISVFQLLHERPSTNPGITSWSLEGGRARDALKKKGGFRYISYKNTHMGEAMGTPQRGWLLENGYRWVIIDVERDPTQVQWGARHFGPPVAECGTAIVHRIEPPEQR